MLRGPVIANTFQIHAASFGIPTHHHYQSIEPAIPSTGRIFPQAPPLALKRAFHFFAKVKKRFYGQIVWVTARCFGEC